jgi:hypothetical protein
VNLASLSEPGEAAGIKLKSAIQKKKFSLTIADIGCGFFRWLIGRHPLSKVIPWASLVAEGLMFAQLVVVSCVAKVLQETPEDVETSA